MAQTRTLVKCPVCSRSFVNWTMNQHIEDCLLRSSVAEKEANQNIASSLNKLSKSPELTQSKKIMKSSSVVAGNTFSTKSPELTQSRKNMKSSSVIAGNTLSKSPEFAQSRKNMKSSSVVGNTLSKSPESDSRRNKSTSPPLKRAKTENGPTTSLLKQKEQQYQITAKQNSQQVNVPKKKKDVFVPLAEKLRPKTFEEYVGQTQILGAKSMLKKLLEADEIPSMIFWGPPGCGKTTLANIIANNTKRASKMRFVKLSATMAGVAEVKEVIKIAKNEQNLFQRKTILFVDEIHRFNKMQQDTFLPHVENGTITMIGATTENPSFHVNSALLSRCRVIVLEKLSTVELMTILETAVKALGGLVYDDKASLSMNNGTQSEDKKVIVVKDALRMLGNLCDGDARNALNGLEMAVQSKLNLNDSSSFVPVVTTDDIKESFQRSHVSYDRNGEEHYNIISALHKSVRGSNENAALYWLGRMLVGGENPMYIARRLVRMASEDIGLADPLALNQAVSAFQACHFIGRPECDVILAQATVYLARAPKSVEVLQAYGRVVQHLKSSEGTLPGVPFHLRNAPTKLMKDLGYSKGYKYNPDYDEPVDQEYLPSELIGMDFFKDGK